MSDTPSGRADGVARVVDVTKDKDPELQKNAMAFLAAQPEMVGAFPRHDRHPLAILRLRPSDPVGRRRGRPTRHDRAWEILDGVPDDIHDDVGGYRWGIRALSR